MSYIRALYQMLWEISNVCVELKCCHAVYNMSASSYSLQPLFSNLVYNSLNNFCSENHVEFFFVFILMGPLSPLKGK